MRVLVATTPGTGHVLPVVPVAMGLKRAGHEVVWATASESCGRVERYGFEAIAAGMPTAERNRQAYELEPGVLAAPPRERRRLLFATMFGAVAAPRMHEQLVPIVDDLHPDLIVHELAELAAAPIATALQLPHVTVGYSGALPEALWPATADAVADLWSVEGLDVPADAGTYQHLYLHPLPPALGPAPASAHAQPVRPVGFDGSSTEEPPEWLAALGANRPAVYATLGTELSRASPWLELLAALGALDVDAVATIGPKIDPDQLAEIPDNVRVERYVPQSFLLERVDALVSHAGAGSMLAGAAAGLPQLCLPIAADQWENADAVSSAGAGITLEEDQRSANATSAALRRVLDDPTFSVAAAHVAHQIAVLPHPDEYVHTLESLAGR